MKTKTFLLIIVTIIFSSNNVQSQWVNSTNGNPGIYFNNGNVGIGSLPTDSKFFVNGSTLLGGALSIYGAGLDGSGLKRFTINADYTNHKANYFDGAIGSDGNKMPFYFKWRGEQFNNSALTILGNHNVGIGTSTPSAALQVSNGDIYIEDITKGIIMKSPDGQCWRGKLDNSGNLVFSKIDCSKINK